MSVSKAAIRNGVGELGLAGRPLCVHASLRSFGHVEGGAKTVIAGLLAECCTIVMPTFTYEHEITPPAGDGDRENVAQSTQGRQPYTPDSNEITDEMGAIPRALLSIEGRQRGEHPIDSFSATGPLAEDLIATQTPRNVYGPLYALADAGGYVLLMGVGLNRMTIIHTAEQMTGRNLFQSWAIGPDGQPITAEVGGCSEGFPNLESVLNPIARETTVGSSRWRAFPAQEVLELASAAIAANPEITHCGDPACARCEESVRGGPLN